MMLEDMCGWPSPDPSNDAKRRLLGGASSDGFNPKSKARRIDDDLSPIHSLSSEVLHEIISRCDRKELLSLCRTSKHFYQIAMPTLYSTFNPRHWTEVLELSKNIREGVRPSGVSNKALITSIMSAMKTIDLRFGPHFPPKKDTIDQRSHEWILQTTLDSLIYIVQQAKNIR
jgi:hypothetical protein